MNSKAREPYIAYIVQQYPSLRKTFIRREIEELRRLGLDVRVTSIRPADPKDLRAEPEVEPERKLTHNLSGALLSLRAIWANLSAALRFPFRYCRNVQLLTADPGRPGLMAWVRLVLQWWRAAILAAHLRQMGTCVQIHAHFADGAATTALAAARLLGVPFSFTSHTSFDSPALVEKLREAVFVASISEFDRAKLIGVGGPAVAEKIHVIRCGIQLDHWPFRLGREMREPARVLAVGALIEKKGHDILIGACGLLRDAGRRIECRIVGAGPLKQMLDELISDLELAKSVSVLGPLSQAGVREQLDWADVFVLACRQVSNGDTDGIPVSLMEAMAAGVPVVSTRIAGVPELVVHGRTGYLAEPDDVRSLAARIDEALAESAERGRIVQEARLHIEQCFDEVQEARRLQSLFVSARPTISEKTTPAVHLRAN